MSEQTTTATSQTDHESLTIDVILEMAEKFKKPDATHFLMLSENMFDALNHLQPDEFLKIKDGEQIGTDIVRVNEYLGPKDGYRIPIAVPTLSGIAEWRKKHGFE